MRGVLTQDIARNGGGVRQETIRYAPLALIVLINGLFSYKYSLRVMEFALPVTIFYCSLLFALPFVVRNIPERFLPSGVPTALFLLFIVAAIVYLTGTHPSDLRVDRWSVIDSFWDTAFSGSYPYSAASHLGNPPGPLPFYFVLALPFYLLGEIGYFSLAGVLVFTYAPTLIVSETRARFILTLSIIGSTAILWEVATRSTILVNASLAVMYIVWFHNNARNTRRLLLHGVVGGLVLSTRFIVVLPLLALYVFYFLRHRDWKHFVVVGSACSAGFLLTLLPLVLWDFGLFLRENPLVLEASLIPLPVAIVATLCSLLVGWLSKTKQELLWHCGLLLFLTVAAYLVFRVIEFGWTTAYLESAADISYMIFSLPFLYASLFVVPEETIPNEAARH